MMFSITVPASTANLGPGFDSIGLALNKYLYLEGSQAEQWVFECDSPGLTNLKPTNLITEAASFASKHFGSSLPPCHVKMENEIPLAKGFGSSAAATVAGIELASYFCRSAVSKADKARIASLWEGHPDNVAASIYGGLVIGAHRQMIQILFILKIPRLKWLQSSQVRRWQQKKHGRCYQRDWILV